MLNLKNKLSTIIFVVNLGMLLAVVVVLLQLGNSFAIHFEKVGPLLLLTRPKCPDMSPFLIGQSQNLFFLSHGKTYNRENRRRPVA
jgi:hypothetical protein